MSKKAWLLCSFAFSVGLIFSLQNLIPSSIASKDPQLIFTPFNGGDENLYAAQVQEVFEGKLFSGDPFIYETKTAKPFLPWLGSLIFGLLAKIFGSLEIVFILSDFFLPAIIFLILFKLILKISKHFWGSILAGLSPLFLYHLTTKFPPVTLKLAQAFWQTLSLKTPYFFGFNRLIPPQFTFIVFLLFLFSLYQVLATSASKSKPWSLSTGIFSGILAYLYFYHWSASLVILAMSFFISLISRSKNSRRLGLALLVCLVVSSGYLYQIFTSLSPDKQISFGRINGRFIEPLTTLRYGLVSLFIFLIPLKKPVKQLLLSVFIAAVILMNLQLIIGFTLAPGHWPHSTFEPLLVMSVFIILALNFKKILPDSWKAGLLTIPILFYAVFNQIKITHQWQSLYFLPSSEARLFQWLNQNSQPESVVLTLDKRLNRYLPVLTHNNTFLPYGSYSQLTTSQLWQRINLAFSLSGLTKEKMANYLTNTQFVGQVFDQTYNFHQRSDLAGLDFPEDIKNRILASHPVFTFGIRYIPDNIKQQQIQASLALQPVSLTERACRYRLDYVILTLAEQQFLSAFVNQDIFQPVFKAENLTLFQLNPNLCQT